MMRWKRPPKLVLAVWALGVVLAIGITPFGAMWTGTNEIALLSTVGLLLLCLIAIIPAAVLSGIRRRWRPVALSAGTFFGACAVVLMTMVLFPWGFFMDLVRGKPQVVAYHRHTVGRSYLTLRRNNTLDYWDASAFGSVIFAGGRYLRQGEALQLHFDRPPYKWPSEQAWIHSGYIQFDRGVDPEHDSEAFRVIVDHTASP